jgi:hypothetical protein
VTADASADLPLPAAQPRERKVDAQAHDHPDALAIDSGEPRWTQLTTPTGGDR